MISHLFGFNFFSETSFRLLLPMQENTIQKRCWTYSYLEDSLLVSYAFQPKWTRWHLLWMYFHLRAVQNVPPKKRTTTSTGRYCVTEYEEYVARAVCSRYCTTDICLVPLHSFSLLSEKLFGLAYYSSFQKPASIVLCLLCYFGISCQWILVWENYSLCVYLLLLISTKELDFLLKWDEHYPDSSLNQGFISRLKEQIKPKARDFSQS